MNTITEVTDPYDGKVVSRIRWTDQGYHHQHRPFGGGPWADYKWVAYSDLHHDPAVVYPTPKTPEDHIEMWCKYWKSRGCEVKRLTPTTLERLKKSLQFP